MEHKDLLMQSFILELIPFLEKIDKPTNEYLLEKDGYKSFTIFAPELDAGRVRHYAINDIAGEVIEFKPECLKELNYNQLIEFNEKFDNVVSFNFDKESIIHFCHTYLTNSEEFINSTEYKRVNLIVPKSEKESKLRYVSKKIEWEMKLEEKDAKEQQNKAKKNLF